MRKQVEESPAAESARRATGAAAERDRKGGGFRPGVNARRYSACCAARISSRCRGNWGSWRPVDLRPSGVRHTTGLPRVGTGAVRRLRATARDAVARLTAPRASRRRAPVGAATDEVLVGHIRRVLEASPFHGEGYRKAWATLRVERIRTSQDRVRRLMREHGLQAPYRAGHAHGPTVTVGEGATCVFVAVDPLYDRVHRSPCGQAWHPV